MANTSVRPTAVHTRASAARNLPTTTSQSRTGMVDSSRSSVPDDRSSASRRIVTAGTMNMNRNGMKPNSWRSSACFSRKSCVKNRYPVMTQ